MEVRNDMLLILQMGWQSLVMTFMSSAALNYYANSKNITRADKLRFLKYYFSTWKISEQDKLFVLKIIIKTNRMIKHAR